MKRYKIKERLMILTLLLFGIIIFVYLISSEIEYHKQRDRKAVEQYEKCLSENFNVRYDCATHIEGYSYQELDKLRNK